MPVAQTSVTRQDVDGAIQRHDWNQARASLHEFFWAAPGLATAQFVISRSAQLDERFPRLSYRLAFLRSFTLEPAVPLLEAAAALHGVALKTYVGEFNAIAQDLLNPGSALYAFEPQAVVIAQQTRDLFPDIWNRYVELTPEDEDRLIETALAEIRTWLSRFRVHSQASVILHNLELPQSPAGGILDSQSERSQSAAIRRFNAALRKVAGEHKGVYVLDYDAVVARYGRQNWHDERKWLTMRMPIAVDNLIHMAGEWLRYLLPLTGKVAKALVLDLDNTLWGGVIGEDGMTGIKIGGEHPGAHFTALQRAILEMYHRGIILAICSKNNHADAMEVLEQHAEMLLKPHHFAAMRINWNDKAQNLREIAAELNIGIDALAFMDDNPVERTRVRLELPEVAVLEVPVDPAGYAATLRDAPLFERLTVSAEDRERGKMYVEQRQRAELEQSAASVEDYYRSLRMVAEVEPVNAASVARVAQLTQKTNQFNLTTKRYTEAEITALSADPKWRVYSLRVRDRFGDNGLVGVALVENTGDTWEIDTFLMSCRVIGRTVETAFLAVIAEEALKAGATMLAGWFIPTKKNAPAAGFYRDHGFTCAEERDDRTLWRKGLSDAPVARPEWIEVMVAGGNAA